MSGGGSQTSTTSVPEWVRPYAETFMRRSQQTADLPYQPFTGNTVAQFNPMQTGALNATAVRAMQGSPVNASASAELQRTLGGDYLNQGNPYMDALVNKSQGDLIRGYQQSVIPQLDMMSARSGSFGNTGVAEAGSQAQQNLVRGLGDISTNLRGGAYESERNRMVGGIGQAAGVANQDYEDINRLLQAGNSFQGQEQRNLDDNYARFQEARDYPLRQLEIMGSGLGNNFGSQTAGPGPNRAAGAMGGAMTGATIGSMFGPAGMAIGGLGGAMGGGK